MLKIAQAATPQIAPERLFGIGAPTASLEPLARERRPLDNSAYPEIRRGFVPDLGHQSEIIVGARKPVIQKEPIIGTALASGDETLEYDDGLLAVAGPIMIMCFALFFAIAAFSFFGTATALFAVGVSASFAVVFFAVPVVMLRIRSRQDARWHKDPVRSATSLVDVWTGPMRRWEAILQIVSIPLAMLMGFAMLAIRWSLL